MTMLEIHNLHVRVVGKPILQGIDLRVNAGEVHAIMGPNGSGKSTLARALSGHPDYQVMEGEVSYEGRDLLAMDPEERAREGVFMFVLLVSGRKELAGTVFVAESCQCERTE